MSLTDRLVRFFRFREYIDSICLTRSGLNAEICRIAVERRELNELVLIVAQFPASFLEIQQALDSSGTDYRIQAEPLDEDRLRALAHETPNATSSATSTEQSTGQIVLTLGQMFLQLPMSQMNFSRDPKIAVIVMERHPLVSHDQLIVNAAREFPFPTSVGFFVALDDPLLAPMNADWVGSLLRQMGASDHELISSQMVSRRVRAAQRRLKNRDAESNSADSAEEWFEKNT